MPWNRALEGSWKTWPLFQDATHKESITLSKLLHSVSFEQFSNPPSKFLLIGHSTPITQDSTTRSQYSLRSCGTPRGIIRRDRHSMAIQCTRIATRNGIRNLQVHSNHQGSIQSRKSSMIGLRTLHTIKTGRSLISPSGGLLLVPFVIHQHDQVTTQKGMRMWKLWTCPEPTLKVAPCIMTSIMIRGLRWAVDMLKRSDGVRKWNHWRGNRCTRSIFDDLRIRIKACALLCCGPCPPTLLLITNVIHSCRNRAHGYKGNCPSSSMSIRSSLLGFGFQRLLVTNWMWTQAVCSETEWISNVSVSSLWRVLQRKKIVQSRRQLSDTKIETFTNKTRNILAPNYWHTKVSCSCKVRKSMLGWNT